MGATGALVVQAGLGAVKTAFDISKSLSELLKQPTTNPVEVASQLNLLHQYLFDAQRSLYDAGDEIKELRSRLDRRKEIEADKHWEVQGGFYRRKSEMAQDLFIPYCPICWHASDNTIPMAECQTRGAYKCGLHEPIYWTNREASSGFQGVMGPRRLPDQF